MIQQIAELVKSFQELEIPQSMKGYGGMTFDGEGNIVGGELTTYKAGPFKTYSEMMKAMLCEKLATADASDILRGWASIRTKIEEFVEKSVDELIGNVDTSKRMLVHGDFTMNNMLYDRKSGKITALLDFDWAHIGHPLTDHLGSFATNYARLPDRYDTSDEKQALREALLTGSFPNPLPKPSDRVEWETARMWEEQLAAVAALRVSTARRRDVEILGYMFDMLELLCPGGLTNETIVGMRGRAGMEKEKEEVEAILRKALDDWENGKITQSH